MSFLLNNWPYSFIVLALTFADSATTIYALKYRTGLRETNEEAAYFQRKLGLIPGTLVFKLPFVPIVFIPGLPWPALAAIGLGHLVFVVHNLKKIAR
jgi:hypothetical protein